MNELDQALPKSGSALNLAEQFRSQRQDTLYQLLLAFVLGVAETIVLYLALSIIYRTPPLPSFLGQVPDTTVPWPVAVMLSRGLLQPLNFCLFGYGATLLILRLWALRREFRAFEHQYLAGLPTDEHLGVVIQEQSRQLPLQIVQRIAQDYSGTPPLLVRRLEAGSRRLADEGDATQVNLVMQTIAEIDRDALESRFTILRYLIWLIPTIGFLGTVMGIGRAIAGFTGFLGQIGKSGGDFQAQLQPVLGGVAGELGVAFDTTVLALLLSAIIVALTSVVQSREEGLLSGVDEFCLRAFIGRIAVPDVGTKQLGMMLQQSLMVMNQGGSGHGARGGADDSFSLSDVLGKLDQLIESLSNLKRSTDSFADASEKNRKAMEDWTRSREER